MKKIGILAYCGIFALSAMDRQEERDPRLTTNGNTARNGGFAGAFLNNSQPQRLEANDNNADGPGSLAGMLVQGSASTGIQANNNNAEGRGSRAGTMIINDDSSFTLFLNQLFNGGN